jgi:hypothetical protein
VDWIHLAQYRVQWRAVVNTVMKLRVQWIRNIYSIDKKLLVSQVRLSSLDLLHKTLNTLKFTYFFLLRTL